MWLGNESYQRKSPRLDDLSELWLGLGNIVFWTDSFRYLWLLYYLVTLWEFIACNQNCVWNCKLQLYWCKKIIEKAPIELFCGKAVEVKEFKNRLESGNIRIKIEPNFPYWNKIDSTEYKTPPVCIYKRAALFSLFNYHLSVNHSTTFFTSMPS